MRRIQEHRQAVQLVGLDHVHAQGRHDGEHQDDDGRERAQDDGEVRPPCPEEEQRRQPDHHECGRSAEVGLQEDHKCRRSRQDEDRQRYAARRR